MGSVGAISSNAATHRQRLRVEEDGALPTSYMHYYSWQLELFSEVDTRIV